jgi:hypothetical protein
MLLGRRWLAVVLAASLGLGACSGGSAGPQKPDDPRETPESLTEALMVLWQARDRKTADRLGGDEPMDSLFSVTPPKAAIEVVRCDDEPSVPGARTCIARGGGRTVLVTVAKRDRWWQAVSILPVQAPEARE